MRTRASGLLLGVMLAAVVRVGMAHDDAWMDRQITPNGGMLRMAGALHLELVRTPETAVYVTTHAGQALDTTGAEASLAVERAAGRQDVALQPAGDNVLKPASPLQLAPDEPVVLVVKLAGSTAETARFVPSKPAAPVSAPTPEEPAADPHRDHGAHH